MKFKLVDATGQEVLPGATITSVLDGRTTATFKENRGGPMNDARRKTLAEAKKLFESGVSLVKQAQELVSSAHEEEEEYLENMPEGLQNSEKGEKATAAIEAMNTFIDVCDNIEDDADFDTMVA